jgi:hypothetical protein
MNVVGYWMTNFPSTGDEAPTSWHSGGRIVGGDSRVKYVPHDRPIISPTGIANLIAFSECADP